MLKIQLRSGDAKQEYIKMNPEAINIVGDNIVFTSKGHGLKDNDNLRLEYYPDYDAEYLPVDFTVIDDDNFSIPKLPQVDYSVTNVYKGLIPEISSGDTLILEFSNKHFWGQNEEHANGDNYYDYGSGIENGCNDDIVFAGGYLFTSSISTAKTYNLIENLNFKNAVVNVDYSAYTYTLDSGYTITDINGNIDQYILTFLYNDDEDRTKCLDYMYEHPEDIRVYYDDIRFFTKASDTALEFRTWFNGKQAAFIAKESYFYSLSIPLGESFAVDMKRDELAVENHLLEVEKKSIPPIIDYERQQFVPMYYSGETLNLNSFNDLDLKPATEIEFNLHFREREDINGKEWTTIDDGYWNNYTWTDDNGLQSTLDFMPTQKNKDRAELGDLLGCLNFTDDDVFYQKNKLKKSFIRLSFYDSNDRRTQNLLFYSTIFLDGGKMFTKYIANKNWHKRRNLTVMDGYVNAEPIYTEYMDDDVRLGTNFNCKSKYDMSASSEGFYLYLFPDMIEGTGVSEVYMKVEFNHAKYGRVIPMTMPVDNNNIPIVSGKTFPVHYMDKGSVLGINYDKLMNDTYIKLYVKYDFNRKQYVWFLPRTTDMWNGKSNKIIFNLWEPRLNGDEIF